MTYCLGSLLRTKNHRSNEELSFIFRLKGGSYGLFKQVCNVCYY